MDTLTAPETRYPCASEGGERERLIVVAAVIVLVLIGLASILLVNGGVFTFTLDDAYIHLRLAR